VALPVQLLSVWAAILGVLFHDAWSRRLRSIGLAGLMAGCVLAACWPAELPDGLPAWIRPCYLGAVVACTILGAYAMPSRAYFFAGAAMLVISAGRLTHDGSLALQRIAHWDGAVYFVVGLVWLGLAVLISSSKAGLGKYLIRIIPGPISDQSQRDPGRT
jgi:hypothetical protein